MEKTTIALLLAVFALTAHAEHHGEELIVECAQEPLPGITNLDQLGGRVTSDHCSIVQEIVECAIEDEEDGDGVSDAEVTELQGLVHEHTPCGGSVNVRNLLNVYKSKHDVNECSAGTHNCNTSPYQECVDKVGGFDCQCTVGYVRDDDNKCITSQSRDMYCSSEHVVEGCSDAKDYLNCILGSYENNLRMLAKAGEIDRTSEAAEVKERCDFTAVDVANDLISGNDKDSAQAKAPQLLALLFSAFTVLFFRRIV